MNGLNQKDFPIQESGHDKPKQKLETEKRKKYLEWEKELEVKHKEMEEIPEWKAIAIHDWSSENKGKILKLRMKRIYWWYIVYVGIIWIYENHLKVNCKIAVLLIGS